MQETERTHAWVHGAGIEEGLSLVVAELGTLLAGGVIVPLDPAYPAQRARPGCVSVCATAAPYRDVPMRTCTTLPMRTCAAHASTETVTRVWELIYSKIRFPEHGFVSLTSRGFVGFGVIWHKNIET